MKKIFVAIVLILVVGIGLFLFYQVKSSFSGTQQTLAMIKPDAVAANQSGLIISRIEEAGLQVIAMKMTRMTAAEAGRFYAVHQNRPFYSSLIEFMSSGPIVVMVLEGNNAVAVYRQLMGATDPLKAAPESLRKQFGSSVEHNAVHGSDSVENAKKEIAFFFTENQIYPRNKNLMPK